VAARAQDTVPRMNLWSVLTRSRDAARAQAPLNGHWLDTARQRPDLKRLLLLIGLGGLSWVATYVGMLELIQANLGDLPLTHKVIIGFSCAMLMTMIIWLLDKMFAPASFSTRLSYIAGYLFLSIISVGFAFGFYWKVLESRGVASRSAESAVTQVQSELFGASTRLEQLQSTLDQLTTVSAEKAQTERASGRTCHGSAPGDGPRRKMREDDAQRFKFASDFVKGRITTVKSDVAALDTELQKILTDDRSLRFGGQHQDGRLAALADLAADLEAVAAGEHEVEDHEVRVVAEVEGQRLVAVTGRHDGEALLLEVQPHELDDVALVVDDEDGLHEPQDRATDRPIGVGLSAPCKAARC